MSMTIETKTPVGREHNPGTNDILIKKHALEQFLFHQAELLDGKHWQQYIDLFCDDGIYWMPAQPQDEHWEGKPSVFTEDKRLMSVRMKRILHPDAWSQKPIWHTSHIVGNITVDDETSHGELVVRSRFHLLELRRETSRHFAGRYLHHLIRTGDGFKIKLQRVDMVNVQATYDYVLQAWV